MQFQQFDWVCSHGIEQFPIQCRKTKVITLWPIVTDLNSTMNQSEFKANMCNRRQAQENACGQNTIGFGLDSHWLRKWCGLFLTNHRMQ